MSNRRRILVLLAVGGSVLGGLCGLVYWLERSALWASRHGYRISAPVEHTWYPYPVPGLRRPAVVSAASTALDGDEEVIGVELGGRARAYRLAALQDRSRHVVNDVVGGVPVSVAYCDLSNCVQVYTEPGGSAPLDVGIAGLFDGEMVVSVRGALYIHKTGAPLPSATNAARLPLETLAPVRLPWKEWLRRHPGTEVYEGDRTTGPSPRMDGKPGS